MNIPVLGIALCAGLAIAANHGVITPLKLGRRMTIGLHVVSGALGGLAGFLLWQ